jgi:nitrogen fixation protein
MNTKTIDNVFFIDKNNFNDILTVCNKNEHVKHGDTIQSLFLNNGWKLNFDQEGNVNGITLDDESKNYDWIFNITARYIKDGSYIIFENNRDIKWKYEFFSNRYYEIDL